MVVVYGVGVTGDEEKDRLLRQFEAAVAGAELDDLRELTGTLIQFPRRLLPEARPDLRKPRRTPPAVLRIRVDLDQADPPIWRRLDVRSDLTLDVVHQILQAAFGWTDSHLHRFSLGGDPFDLHSQLFLCPYDADEGEDDGLPESEVRLDETLADPGDELRYVYDYGDSWDLVLWLEEVLPAGPGTPIAACVDGDRAAPPENCGGVTDAESLAQVLDDPARFDRRDIDEALRAPYFRLLEQGVDPRLGDLVHRLTLSPDGDTLVARLHTLLARPLTRAMPDGVLPSLRAHQWFLDRASDGGIPLTSAGYLKPVDVEAACQVVPSMGDWYGKNNREVNAVPLLDFRQSLQRMGLLRKSKSSLLPTRAGAAAHRDPQRLWDHLAMQLRPVDDGFEADAGLLYLLYAATTEAREEVPLSLLARHLTELGWRHRDGRPLRDYELGQLRESLILREIDDHQRDVREYGAVSAGAAALARAALLTPEP